jgi:hypothetical protein
LSSGCKSTRGPSSSASATALPLSGQDWQTVRYTDPRSFHAPNRTNPPFLFLVVGVFDPKLRDMQHDLTAQEAAQKNIVVKPSKAIDLLETPERIADKPVISASLIDQDHVETWGYSGFILAASDGNVIAASTSDLGLDGAMIPGTPAAKIRRVLREVRKTFSKPSPAELLRRTHPKRYNEVGLVGRAPGGAEVEVVGVFIKTDPVSGEDLCSPVRTEQMEQIASEHGWPLVRIWQPRPVTKRNRSKDSTEHSF